MQVKKQRYLISNKGDNSEENKITGNFIIYNINIVVYVFCS